VVKHSIKYFRNILNLVSASILFLVSFFAYAQNITIPEVLFYNKPLYTFRGKTPHISMPLSVEFTISSSAWNYPRVPKSDLPAEVLNNVDDKNIITYYSPIETKFVKYTNNNEQYSSSSKLKNNLGYFNHILCYSYDSVNKYFIPKQQLDENRSCPNSEFSGSYLNWVSMTTLDLLRYSLTGGSRDIDTAGITVLKKARTIDYNEIVLDTPQTEDIDFRDTIKPIHYNEASGVSPAGHKYAQSCGTKLYFSSDIKQIIPLRCSDMEAANPIIYEARVLVCNELDTNLRPEYCQKYPSGGAKPVGAIQKNSDNTRFSLLSYLNTGLPLREFLSDNGINPMASTWQEEAYNKGWGGVLRAPARFVGKNKYDPLLNFQNNHQKEWNEENGTLILDANHEFQAGKISVKANSILHNGNTPNTIRGNESTAEGTSIINYINEFGYYDRYRDIDNFAELLGETLRYLANYSNATYKGLLDPADPSSGRDPFNFYHKMDGLPHAKRVQGIQMHTDTFPFLKIWNIDDENKAVRSVCEKDNNHIITVADVNNWRQKIITTTGWHTTALSDLDDTMFNGSTLRNIMNSINPNLHHLSSPLGDASHVERFGHTQNRYLSSALLAGANLYGLNYQNENNIKINRVKSNVIDVGEPSLVLEDCHLYTAGIYGNNSLDEINTLISKGKTCSNWATARNGKSLQAMDNLLPNKGYFYPSSPNKIVENIQQAFNLPIEVSGNTSPGAVQDLGFVTYNDAQGNKVLSRKVYLFKNNLESPKALDTALSTKLEKYELYSENGIIQQRKTAESLSWESGLRTSLRNHAVKNVLLGGALNTDINGAITSRKNPLDFTYSSLKTANDIDAVNSLNIGLAQKEDSIINQDDLLRKRIEYIRGSSEKEQTEDVKGLFRARNNVIGSTVNSTPVYKSKADILGLNVLYLAGNDGIMRGIDADNGKELFNFIPRAVLQKIYQSGEQNYVDSPLIESTPVVKSILPSTNASSTKRKTVLVSGYGSGARGLFALDVTRLHSKDEDKSIKASDILFEFSDKDDPTIGNIIGEPEFVTLKTGIVDKGGIPTNIVETMVAVTSGYNNNSKTQYLYLLKTNKPYNQKWIENVNYYKLIVASDIVNNGLSAPASISFDGLTQNVYMGDLQGNMWRINFNGRYEKIAAKALFTNNGQSTSMPITAKPNLAYTADGVMVVFGTGRYFGLNDLGESKKTKQALIAINDQQLSVRPYQLEDLDNRAINNAKVEGLSSSKSKGWYILLPNASTKGERITTQALIQDGQVAFTTQILGSFNKSTCGSNEGARASVNFKDGIGNYYIKPDDNQSQDNIARYVGSLIMLPNFNLNELGSSGTTKTSVQRNNTAISLQSVYGQATDVVQEIPIGVLNAQGSAKLGVISWREILNSKIN